MIKWSTELQEIVEGFIESQDDERVLEVDNYSALPGEIVIGIVKADGDLEEGQYYWALSRKKALSLAKTIIAMCEPDGE
jgi:hypothetical protein